MSTVQIFRDAPVIANKIRPKGSITDSFGQPITLPVPIITYLFSGIVANPELIQLTQLSRRGNRKLRERSARTLWQEVF